MDPIDGAAARFRLRKTQSPDRFLGAFALSRPETAVSDAGDELNEDDVFWTGDYTEHNRSSNTSLAAVNRNHHHHRGGGGGGGGKGFGENFGILAALPAAESDRSVFNHKASISPSSSSSSASSSRMMIPAIPKRPPLDRQNSGKHYQSAPVNVPVLSEAMRRNQEIRKFDDIVDEDDDDNEGDCEMLPPHEIVASKQSPLVACSVLEGVGRTLKGRDLRQVRNAVWRKTGFID